MKKQEKKALAIGGGLGIILFGFVVTTFFEDFTEEYQEEIPQEQIGEVPTENTGGLEEDELATIGQNFIQTMASYDQEQAKPILLQSIEKLDDKWQAKYEVEQLMGDVSLVYFYTVDIVEGRVVRQNIAVGDRSRRILLSNPEPDSIVENTKFVVKGQVFDGQEEVTIKLMNQETEEVLIERKASVELEKNAVYSVPLTISGDLIGDYILEITDGQSALRTAIVLSKRM